MMMAQPATGSPSGRPDDNSPRFGVVVDGFRLMLPKAAMCDFSPATRLYHLPLAPERLIGLAHSRGFGVPVFDCSKDMASGRTANQQISVLIVGQGSQAGGIVVDGPPQLLKPINPAQAGARHDEEDDLSEALSRHPAFSGLDMQPVYAGQTEGTGEAMLWWNTPFFALFERLSQLKGH